jgi:hypothetical protein
VRPPLPSLEPSPRKLGLFYSKPRPPVKVMGESNRSRLA